MDGTGRARRIVPRAVGVAALVLMVPTTGACDGDAPTRRGDQGKVVTTAAPAPSPEEARRRTERPRSPDRPLRGSERHPRGAPCVDGRAVVPRGCVPDRRLPWRHRAAGLVVPTAAWRAAARA